jgi:hypothetical protein
LSRRRVWQREAANYYYSQSSHRKTIPSFHGRGGPISEHTNGLGKNRNMVMGPKTKNDCAGKSQQQITGLQDQSQEPSRMGTIEHYGESSLLEAVTKK